MKNNIFKNYLDCMGAKYFKFSGLMNRKDYWNFIFMNILILVSIRILSIIFYELDMKILGNTFYFLKNLYIIFSAIPFLGATTRRLHDVGKPSYFIIFLISPIIFGIIGFYLAFFTITINGAGNFLIVIGIILIILAIIMPLYIFYLTICKSK